MPFHIPGEHPMATSASLASLARPLPMRAELLSRNPHLREPERRTTSIPKPATKTPPFAAETGDLKEVRRAHDQRAAVVFCTCPPKQYLRWSRLSMELDREIRLLRREAMRKFVVKMREAAGAVRAARGGRMRDDEEEERTQELEESSLSDP